MKAVVTVMRAGKAGRFRPTQLAQFILSRHDSCRPAPSPDILRMDDEGSASFQDGPNGDKMGLTMQHAAVVVPIVTGVALNFVGYQTPFLAAGGFAVVMLFVTRSLDPANQKAARRLQEEAALAAR